MSWGFDKRKQKHKNVFFFLSFPIITQKWFIRGGLIIKKQENFGDFPKKRGENNPFKMLVWGGFPPSSSNESEIQKSLKYPKGGGGLSLSWKMFKIFLFFNYEPSP